MNQVLFSLMGFSVNDQHLTSSEGFNMNTISKFKISFVTFLSLFSTSIFAGITQPPVVVSEPSILALLGAGAVAVLFIAKKRKK